MPSPSPRVWATLLSGNDLNRSLNAQVQVLSVKTFSAHPHLTLVTPDVATATRARLRELGSSVLEVEPITPPNPIAHLQWWCVFTKLRAFELSAHAEQVAFIDNDALLTTPAADGVFSACSAELCGVRDLTLAAGKPMLNAGLLVVRPSPARFAQLSVALSESRTTDFFPEQQFLADFFRADAPGGELGRGVQELDGTFNTCNRDALLLSQQSKGQPLAIYEGAIVHACAELKLAALPMCGAADASPTCRASGVRVFQHFLRLVNPCVAPDADSCSGAGCRWCNAGPACLMRTQPCLTDPAPGTARTHGRTLDGEMPQPTTTPSPDAAASASSSSSASPPSPIPSSWPSGPPMPPLPPPPPRPPAPPPPPSPPPPLLAATIAAARTAIAALAANEEVEIWLDEGSMHTVSTAICVHNVRVALRSQGVGARIDGLGETRIFDVAHGGRLVLERVNLTNGGDVWSGAAISARGNSFVDVRHATISDSHAVQTYPSVSPKGGALAASLPAVAEIDRLFEWASYGGGSFADDVSEVAVSPDGSRVAIARGVVHVLDVATGVMSTSAFQVGSHASRAQVRRSDFWQTDWPDGACPVSPAGPASNEAVLKPLAWHPDGSKLAVIASGLRTFSVLDASSLQTLCTSPDSGTDLRSVAWSPTGTTIATGYDQVTYDSVHGFTEPWLRIWELDAETPALTSVSTIHDPKDLNDLPADDSCAYVNVTGGSSEHAVSPVTRCGEVFALAFAPDGRTLFASSSDQRIRQINATNHTHALQTHTIDTMFATGQHNAWTTLPVADGPMLGATALALSADGQWLAYAGRLTIDNAAVLQRIQVSGGTSTGEYAIVVLNANDLSQVVQTLEGHTNRVKDVAFSPDGTKLASASYDFTIKLWSVASGTLLETIDGHQKVSWCCEVNTISWSPDGQRLFSGSLDSTVRSWDVGELDGLGLQRLQHIEVELAQGLAQTSSVAWPLKGGNILVWGRAQMDGDALMGWDRCSSCPGVESGCAGDGCWWEGPAGDPSVGGTPGAGLFRLDPVTGAMVEHVATDDHTNVATDDHTTLPRCSTLLRCSDNGAFCALADRGRAAIQIFDAHDLSASVRTVVESGNVGALAWSPSGARLATSLVSADDCSGDYAIRIWDPALPDQSVLWGQGHNCRVTGLAYSPDGSLLASSSRSSYLSPDYTIMIWNSSDMSLLQTGTQPSDVGHIDHSYDAIAWAPDGERVRATRLSHAFRHQRLAPTRHRPGPLAPRQSRCALPNTHAHTRIMVRRS